MPGFGRAAEWCTLEWWAEASRSPATGRAGAVASIAKARGAIIGLSDCDREHLFPLPIRHSRRAFTCHAGSLANPRHSIYFLPSTKLSTAGAMRSQNAATHRAVMMPVKTSMV
jgi:hypothetical protein